jgi:uncharacterized protein (DUF849 family)
MACKSRTITARSRDRCIRLQCRLPFTPDEILAESAAAQAGAAIIHLHARDPKDGRPSPSPDLFVQFLSCMADGLVISDPES